MQNFKLYLLVFVFLFNVFFINHEAQASMRAPELSVSEWVNGDPGPLRKMSGKVVVIDFFQMWCPGCSSFAIPLMFHLEKRYEGRNDIIFLSMHTVFEGFAYQTPDDLKEFVDEKGIKHPVGIDDYREEYTTPITMQKYRTGGTPCITIIDKNGYIRFKKLGGFAVSAAENLIDKLLAE